MKRRDAFKGIGSVAVTAGALFATSSQGVVTEVRFSDIPGWPSDIKSIVSMTRFGGAFVFFTPTKIVSISEEYIARLFKL